MYMLTKLGLLSSTCFFTEDFFLIWYLSLNLINECPCYLSQFFTHLMWQPPELVNHATAMDFIIKMSAIGTFNQ